MSNLDDLPKSKPANPGEEGSRQAVRARQGVTGHGVRYVLVASLIAIVVAFTLVVLLVR